MYFSALAQSRPLAFDLYLSQAEENLVHGHRINLWRPDDHSTTGLKLKTEGRKPNLDRYIFRN